MKFTEGFNHAIRFVLKTEGGLNRDVVDMGGITKYGISKKAYPNLDISNLTLEEAKKIYYTDYWKKQNCDAFDLPLSIVIFDSSINCGKIRTGKWLQLTSNENSFPLKVDGIIGTKTVIVSSFVPSHRLIFGIIGRRTKHYSKLIKKYPKQVQFIRGWNNRLGDLLLYI